MRNRVLIALASVLLSQAIIAQDLGNYGKVFDVIEHDIREVILARLNHLKDDGQLDKLEKELQEEIDANL
jgi:conjugal transfer pilus assembly protein TraW